MASGPVRLDVTIPGKTYPVWIGLGAAERIVELAAIPASARAAALVVDAKVAAALPDLIATVIEALRSIGVDGKVMAVSGETAKDPRSLQGLWEAMADAGLNRGDVVVTIGGGVTSDLGGFAAATYHRGVPWIALPTTLLSMVDAAIGGKTGVNLPQGKNLAGAFHQPVAVIADIGLLETLPDTEMATGMAEVLKHGFIADLGLLEMCEEQQQSIVDRDLDVLEQLVMRAAAVKVSVVSADETEQGRRMFLNYGHTLGHALELLGGYGSLTHGQAVSIGMTYAASLAVVLGYPDRTAEHRRALQAYGLPVEGVAHGFDAVRAAMAGDKKADTGLRFVVLEELARPVVIGSIPDTALAAAFEAVR